MNWFVPSHRQSPTKRQPLPRPMSKLLAVATTLAMLVSASACESSVVVAVSAPFAVPSEVDSIAVALTSEDGTQTQRFSIDALTEGDAVVEEFWVRRGNETEATGTLAVSLLLDDVTIASRAQELTFPGFGLSDMTYSFNDDDEVEDEDGGVADGG